MRMRGFAVLATLALLGMCSAAQGQTGGYLDSFIAKVKPEKRAEFDAVSKRIAEANRRHKGDTWLASEVIFGDGDTIYFTSVRENYGAVEKGYGSFMEALAKAGGGPAGAGKLMQEFESCLVSSRAELRRRRVDLSTNAPDPAAVEKMVGQARWLRTVIVHVRPGRAVEYADALKEMKAAIEKGDPKRTTLVSQSAAGQHGVTFYLTMLARSMSEFDDLQPLPKVVGEEALQQFGKVAREATLGNEVMISRFVPELSNPPEEIAAAAPDFWRPKPRPAMTKAKPKAEEAPKPQ